MKFKREEAAVRIKRMRLEIQSRNVLITPEMDRLLRYATTLERFFDRRLSQIERAQHLRRGQPVPPEVSVGVTREP